LVNVVTDSEVIACMAAEHLLGCGFQNFAYCGLENTPLENSPWSLSRKLAFIQRIQQAGWDCQVYAPDQRQRRGWHREMGGLVRWLKSIRTPCGLMACNDDRGEQVLEACRLAELCVPSDVAVIGVDNDEVVCGLSNPPLSSISVGFARAGFEVAQALSRMIAGQHDVPFTISVAATHVVARRSTEVIAVADVNLAKALQFIRDHSAGATPVAAVAHCAGVSRRALEKRFRDLLGRSVLQEIRRVRTDRIAQLLVETDLPVARIADLLGFPDPQHVARYFRTAKRLSPAAYRQAYGGKEWRAQTGDLFAQNGVLR
jgi:LacI family transcriptional regulator